MSSCPAKSKVCRVIESSSVPSSDLLLLTPRTAIATSTNNRWCGQPTGTQSVLVKTPYPCLLCIIETSATNGCQGVEESCSAPTTCLMCSLYRYQRDITRSYHEDSGSDHYTDTPSLKRTLSGLQRCQAPHLMCLMTRSTGILKLRCSPSCSARLGEHCNGVKLFEVLMNLNRHARPAGRPNPQPSIAEIPRSPSPTAPPGWARSSIQPVSAVSSPASSPGPLGRMTTEKNS